MKLLRGVAVGVVLMATVACSKGVVSDPSFVETAAIANMFEIQSSELALTKATNADLKTFAQMIIDDHTKAGNELKTLADSGDVPEVTGVPADLDSDHKAKLAELAGADAASFDAKYRSMQIDAHKEAVELFQSEADHGKSDALATWARNTVPTLQGHLTRIQAITVQ